MGEWLRNDNNLAHIAHVDGEYKVNMIFYRAMINATEAVFYVETSGLTEWRKSVVIRGVYNVVAGVVVAGEGPVQRVQRK